MTRAIVARWWGTTPFAIRRLPVRSYREMAEVRERILKAEHDALEAAKMGAPTPGRAPQPPAREEW